jgi:hypothetical protein
MDAVDTIACYCNGNYAAGLASHIRQNETLIRSASKIIKDSIDQVPNIAPGFHLEPGYIFSRELRDTSAKDQ